MGDGADMALNAAMDDYEHYERYKDAPLHIQYEEGIVNEMGGIIGNPNSLPCASYIRRKPTGPGDCPICHNQTTLKEGKFGKFYGCGNFPDCKGSRNC